MYELTCIWKRYWHNWIANVPMTINILILIIPIVIRLYRRIHVEFKNSLSIFTGHSEMVPYVLLYSTKHFAILSFIISIFFIIVGLCSPRNWNIYKYRWTYIIYGIIMVLICTAIWYTSDSNIANIMTWSHI